MVSSNMSALGVIFANTYDNLVPELVAERTMASIPFGGRYRMIDFVLSSMANSGIDNVSIIVRRNYHSLMDHLGAGREWDLTRKRGGLNVFPPYAERSVKVYSGRVDALASPLSSTGRQKEKYLALSTACIAFNLDFNKLIEEHIASGADVTMLYNRAEIPEGARNDNYTVQVKDGRLLQQQNYHLGARHLYVADDAGDADRVVEYTGYAARISDTKSYFDENMRLLEGDNVDQLFDPANPIYTKIRDDNPTRYITGSKVKNSLLADGCVIEGTVENSVLFRGCQVKKGAVVRNSVLMQDSVVEANTSVEYVVTDKNVHITEGKQLCGTDSFPVFVAKNHTV